MLPNSDELVKGLRKKSISFTLHSGIRSLARLPGPTSKHRQRHNRPSRYKIHVEGDQKIYVAALVPI